MTAVLKKTQDPNATLNWTFDWTDELAENGNPTITASVVTTDNVAAVVTGGTSPVGATVTCRLACPTVTLGTLVALTCHVTLSSGEQDYKTHHITIDHT